jgi:hypothetical protein
VSPDLSGSMNPRRASDPGLGQHPSVLGRLLTIVPTCAICIHAARRRVRKLTQRHGRRRGRGNVAIGPASLLCFREKLGTPASVVGSSP